MKKKANTSIFDVHKDSELEALAKAYVQAAHKRKMTMTESNKIIAQIWREDITEPEKNQKLTLMPLQENEDQKLFREKVEKLISEYPEFITSANSLDSEDRKPYTVEIICAIHKYFAEKDRIQMSILLYYIRDYFIQIFKEKKFCNTTKISYCIEHIFFVLNHLVFDTTKYSGIGCLKNVNYTYRPKISENHPSPATSFSRIDNLAEPYLKEKEYDIRRSKTSTAIIQLIWFIETFF